MFTFSFERVIKAHLVYELDNWLTNLVKTLQKILFGLLNIQSKGSLFTVVMK